jgi:hypothetical protein
MESEGQRAEIDPSLVSHEAVKCFRDTVRKELAKTQGSRDVNTKVVQLVEPPKLPNEPFKSNTLNTR